jgi:hypothetical protein
MMRGLLYEAATILLTRVQKWCSLKAWAMAVAKRLGPQKAIVKDRRAESSKAIDLGMPIRKEPKRVNLRLAPHVR